MIGRETFRTATAFLLALGWSTAGIASDPATLADAPKMTPTATFVQQAVVGNLFEVESSKLALERSQNAAVKTFAQLMVNDHSAAGVKIVEAINEAKVARPPLKLDARHVALMETLTSKTGAEFDRIYVEAQHKAHTEAVAMFEGYAAAGEDSHLKAVATQLVPALKSHLAEIQKIAATFK